MASSYTTSLKIQQIGNGEQAGTWGSTTNTNWNLAEQAIAGVQTITMSNTNYTLSNLNGTLDEARNMVLVVSGTNSAIYQVVAPLVNKFYVVTNNTTGGYAITIGGGSGAIVTVPNGTTVQVYCDGTNFYSAQTSSAGNFNVNGNLTVSGNETAVGNMAIGGTLGVTGTSAFTGAATFTASPTMPTPTFGDSTTKGATTAFVQTAISAAGLSGQITMWPTTSAPTGWLLCNGAAVSRTTYSALFAVVGTTFGTGDGSTTFNLPNYQDRMPIGSGTIASSIGATGGSKDAIVVSHNHTATSTDAGHVHLTYYGGGSSGSAGLTAPSGTPIAYGAAYSGTGYASITTTVASAGASGTNANLPPYLGINFIIKT
jgi:microcystin-dependent protein